MQQSNIEKNKVLRCEIYVVGLISALISLLVGFAMNKYLPINIQLATVDITGIIHQFVKIEAEHSNSPVEMEAQIQAFSQQLETTLQSMAKEKHVILVPKEAVIAGGVDFTSEITRQLEKNHAD